MTVVGSATIELRGDATHFERTMARAFTQFKTLGQGVASLDKGLIRAENNLYKFSRNLRSVGTNLTAAVTLPLAAVAAGSAKAAMDFESSFAGIRKTMDLTEAQFRELAQANRDLAKTIPVTANELNRIGELGGQLGIRGVENVLKFEKTIAQLAVTTDLTADQAALSFAQIANVMQLPQDQIDRLGAAVVGLGNNFATVESQIVEFTTRIAGAGKIAGLTVGDVAGIGTAFASLGVNAEAGGTAVQKVLLGMVTAVTQGGAKLETFAATAGMSAAEFQKAFEEDAGGAFVAFVDGLSRQGNGAISTLEKLGLSNERVRAAFLAAAGAGDLLARAVRQGNAEFEANTALTEEASKRFETFQSQLKVLANRLVDVGISLGNALLPVVSDLVDLAEPAIRGITAMARAFEQASKPVQVVTIALAALAAAAPLAMLAISQLISTISSLVLIANTAIGASALAGLGTLLAAGGPIVLGAVAVAGALALVVAKLTESGREAKKAREELDEFRESLGKPVTIDMVRDFNVQASLAAVTVAKLKEEIAAAMDVGDVRLAQDLRGKLDEAEAELERFKFRASQINKLKVETQATVRADISQAETELSTILERIRAIESGEITVDVRTETRGGLGLPVALETAAEAREAELDRLNSQAAEVSARLNELDSDLATFTQSSATATATATAGFDGTTAAVARLRTGFEAIARIKFPAPDFSALGGRSFRGGTIAADLDLDMAEKIGAPNIDIPDLSILTPDQRQKFIDGVPFDELTGKIKSFGQNTKELMFGVGEDLVTGIIQGTLDMGDILKRFLIGFAARFILGPLSSALGIASPSKLTAGLGKEIGRGLVIGIRGMEPAVRLAALGLASAAVVSMDAPITATRSAATTAAVPSSALRTREQEMPPINVEVMLDPYRVAQSAGGQVLIREGITVARKQGFR